MMITILNKYYMSLNETKLYILNDNFVVLLFVINCYYSKN